MEEEVQGGGHLRRKSKEEEEIRAGVSPGRRMRRSGKGTQEEVR